METKEMSEKLTRTVDSVASNAHKAIDKVSGATRPAIEHIAASAHQAADKLNATGRQFKESQARLTDNLREQLRERPFTSIGVAVAAGFLLNWLLRQRPAARPPTE